MVAQEHVTGASAPHIVSELPTVPETTRWKMPADLENKIPQPWVPRANQAVSAECPNPPMDAERSKKSVLQQHVDFWDADGDGKIYPLDTYRGFHAIGFNAFLSFIAVLVIHGTFSYATQDGWFPDPLFSIKVKNISHGKHGSDSGTYDKVGRFIPARFEQIFANFDHDNKGGLTLQEMWEFSQFTREVMDPVGWTAMKLEWGALWWIAHDEKGVVSKEKIRGQYDGTLFHQMAAENAKKSAAKAAKKTNAMSWVLPAGLLLIAAIVGALVLRA